LLRQSFVDPLFARPMGIEAVDEFKRRFRNHGESNGAAAEPARG